MHIQQSLSCQALIDLSILGLGERGCEPDLLIQRVRGMCAPTITPSIDVVENRMVEAIAQDYLTIEDHLTFEDQQKVKTTERGAERMHDLLMTSIEDVSHDLAPACEALKLAFIDRLTSQDAASVRQDLFAARGRCLSAQKQALARCETGCPEFARCRRYQLAMALVTFDDLRTQFANADADTGLKS